MSVSKEELEHIARLADLNLSEEEKQMYIKNLNDILEYAQTINSVDTSSVQETISTNAKYNELRKDEINQCFGDRDKMISNAPSQEAGLFHIPTEMK